VRKEAPRIKGDDVHIAIASVEPGTGALRAMYGGPDYVQSQRNWALTGRQPGSSFKPFALAAGLESGVSLFDTVNGNTVVFRDGTTVRNEFSYQYGAISLLRATEVSSNTGYADLTARVKGGPQTVLESATRAGIPADTPGLRANSVIALGTADVRPVDMANAYATFAARGQAAAWYVLERVIDTAGNIRYDHRSQTSQEFGPGVAADVTYALRQVVEDPAGTGTAAQALRCPAAAKTGTAALRPDTVTSAWFVGYTPQLSTAVMYVRGRDGTADLDGVGGLSTFFGGEYPARTWTTYMNQALRGRPCQGFPKPAFVSGASPTPTPTPTPTPSPSPTPTPTPTPTPSPTPSPTPTPTPSPTPTPTPSPSPSPSPSPTPTLTPTPTPTTSPTPTPTERSTPVAGR
jgi:membrane peptidoglycan carboxypeptidase